MTEATANLTRLVSEYPSVPVVLSASARASIGISFADDAVSDAGASRILGKE
jgi:hypothetical protein